MPNIGGVVGIEQILVQWLVGGYLLLTVSCLLSGEEEGARIPGSPHVLDFLLCPPHLCLCGTFPGLFLGSCLPQAAQRLFFGTEEVSHEGKGTLHGDAWELELNGRERIIEATLHPPYVQPWACFPGVRTEQGLGWVSYEHGGSARKVEGVLSMPGLHFSLPLFTLLL